MKKINIIIGLTVTLIFGVISSCNEENLELRPQTPTEADFFVQESDFTAAVIGTYSRMIRWYAHIGNQNNIAYPVWYLPGDDVTTAGANAFEIFTNINASNTPLDYFYSSSYQLIARANVVLEEIENVGSDVYTTANLKDTHRGEALFLRGLAYFRLWNTFGSAPPLVTSRVTSGGSAYFPPSSEGTELLDQAISDFTEAANLLPSSWADANLGRATANSANGYLGKALVFRATVSGTTADYTAALTAFNKISGVSLVPNFADNFAFDTENNAESLFEFQASLNSFDNPWVGDPDVWDEIGVMSVYWDLFNPDAWTLFGTQPLLATQKLIDTFDPADPRLPLTADPATGVIQKYITRNRKTVVDLGSANNPRMLRYADVLLLKAEALLFSGGSKAEAIGLINQVRERARNINGGAIPADYSTAETSEDVIFEWIREERFLELAAEGKRWWDLRRWELGNKLPFDLNKDFFNSLNPDLNFNVETHLNFPLPLSETDLNPNVTQNTGY